MSNVCRTKATHLRGLVLERDNTSLNHLVVQIVTLAGALADSGKHRVTTMGLGHVVDQLHDQHSLADSGTAEQANLASLGVGGQQVDDLDSGDEDLLLDAHVDELGRLGVDGGTLVGVDGAPLVDRLSDDVDDAAQGLGADRDTDGRASVLDGLATHQTLGTVHGDGADGVLSQVLGDLQHQAGSASVDLQGVQDRGQVLVELDVDDGTDDSDHTAVGHSTSGSLSGEAAVYWEGGEREGRRKERNLGEKKD